MANYVGDYALSTTFYHRFLTVNASGVPTTLGNTPSLEYYVDGGATAFSSGLTLSTDFNTRTGLNSVQVIATSSATGLTTAKNITICIAAGTVSGVSMVGYPIFEYSIANRSALMPTTSGRTLDVSSTGEAGVDWANVGSPTTSVNLSATTISTSQQVASVSGAVGSVTGAVGSVTGNVGGNVVGSVASVSGAVGSVTGAVGSVTGNVGGNVVGSVGSVTAGVTVTTNNDKTGYSTSDWTTQLTESYRANGAAPTPAQAVCEIIAHLGETSISGTVKTINKIDHSTPAETFTLDSATAPSSITRAT